MESKNYFFSNLKFIREQRNISQNQLAKKININQTTIARWEDENRMPTIEKAIEVSEFLNIPLDILIGQDLRIKSEKNLEMPKLTQEAKVTIVKDFFKEKGLLNDDEDISDETLDEIINFAKANKQYLVKKEK